jgi:hypothetical protein
MAGGAMRNGRSEAGGTLRYAAAALMLGLSLGRAGAAGATEIYRWVDREGRVHYSNVPSGGGADKVPELSAPHEPLVQPAEGAGEGGVEAPGAPAVGEAPAVAHPRPDHSSTEASLARSGLEKAYRAAKTRLAEIERNLEDLAAARTRHATNPPASVGGVRAPGAETARSAEEEALEAERDAARRRLEEIRGQFAELRAKVAAGYGGAVPGWWRDLR